jgi:hypothetical protein
MENTNINIWKIFQASTVFIRGMNHNKITSFKPSLKINLTFGGHFFFIKVAKCLKNLILFNFKILGIKIHIFMNFLK